MGMSAAADPVHGDLFGRPLGLIVVLALVSVLPLVLMASTSFVKISTVLQIARSALGTHDVPSNTVLLALAAVLSAVVMAPLATTIASRAAPLIARAPEDPMVWMTEGARAVGEPFREFLHANAAPKEVARFLVLARASRASSPASGVTSASVEERDFAVVVPAFIVSELQRAFALGVAIYLPFLVLDLVVANVLVAAGLSALSPSGIALPLKLLLFLAVDGWGLLARALMVGYRF